MSTTPMMLEAVNPVANHMQKLKSAVKWRGPTGGSNLDPAQTLLYSNLNFLK